MTYSFVANCLKVSKIKFKYSFIPLINVYFQNIKKV